MMGSIMLNNFGEDISKIKLISDLELEYEETEILIHPNDEVNLEKKCLDDFDLLLEIGKGGFGTVYLSKDKQSKKIYAIKAIRKINLLKYGMI